MSRPYGDKRPSDMQVPEAGIVPFPLTGPVPNMPFAPGKTWYPQRLALAAGSANKKQLYQTQTPCQKIVILNEGGGDLIVGNQGVSPTAPVTGGSPQPGFSVAVGGALTIEVEDASQVWLVSAAGTVVSVAVMGSSYVASPLVTVAPNYQVIR